MFDFITTGQVLIPTSGTISAIQFGAGSFYQTISPAIPWLLAASVGIFMLKYGYRWFRGNTKGIVR